MTFARLEFELQIARFAEVEAQNLRGNLFGDWLRKNAVVRWAVLELHENVMLLWGYELLKTSLNLHHGLCNDITYFFFLQGKKGVDDARQAESSG